MALGTRWLWDTGGFGVPGGFGDTNVPLRLVPGARVALGTRWLWDAGGFGVPGGFGDTKVLAGADPGGFGDMVALGSRGLWGPWWPWGHKGPGRSRPRLPWGHKGPGRSRSMWLWGPKHPSGLKPLRLGAFGDGVSPRPPMFGVAFGAGGGLGVPDSWCPRRRAPVTCSRSCPSASPTASKASAASPSSSAATPPSSTW